MDAEAMTGKVYLICGMICSGKSTLAERLSLQNRAAILSCDELTKALGDDLGDLHDAIAARIHVYLQNKAVALCRLGVNVILEWGFWRAADRAEISRFLSDSGVPFEWHYMDVSPERLARNIASRNARPGPCDYIVDQGLLDKCRAAFEPPAAGEMDVVHTSANC